MNLIDIISFILISVCLISSLIFLVRFFELGKVSNQLVKSIIENKELKNKLKEFKLITTSPKESPLL